MYSTCLEVQPYSTCRDEDVHRRGHLRSIATPARLLALCVLSLALGCMLAASASAATYSQTQTTPVPPASNFAGGGGGDGWSVALSQDKVYNVFHHNNVMTVACHKQSDASACWAPTTVRDASGGHFSTSGQPGMSLDQSSGKLYVYGTRNSDSTSGVVCFDTALALSNPFCGFTALTQTGGGQIYSWSTLSVPMQVGNRWYAFNYVGGQGAGGAGAAQNKLLCFDLSTHAACAGQPYSVVIGNGSVAYGAPSPTTAAIGDQLIIPINVSGINKLACFDAGDQGACTGSWPVATGVPTVGRYGSPFPLMDATGTITGFCLPTGNDECFTLSGASTATPAAMRSVIGASEPWNGPAVVLGPRVYVPNGAANGYSGQVQCYDYSTSARCPNFPKNFTNLSYLYTVNSDPQRPTCLWVNADGGGAQIQSFDAYTGGACGQGATRVLTSQFVVPQQQCSPTSYQSLRIVAPGRATYASGTVAFADGAGNPIAGIAPLALDANGTVDLTGLALNTTTGLPQFLITLNGALGGVGQIEVELTWTDSYDPACVAPGTKVAKEATTVTTSLSGGGETGAHITVLEGTSVTDTATLAGPNSSSAGGTVKYTWYSDSSCSTVVSDGGEQTITTPGTLPASAALSLDTPGTYHVVAGYSGDDGNSSSAGACGDEVVTVRALNGPPTVEAITGATSPDEGTTKTYAVSATDPDAGDTLSYAWSVTGGHAQISGPADGSSVHVDFTDGPSAVTIQVIVDDGHGHSATRTLAVSERNVAPTLSSLVLSGNTGVACPGTTNAVGLSFSFSDPAAAADSYSGTIHWGDGSSSSFSGSPVSASHQYAPGDYTIKVDVADEDGGTDHAETDAVSRLYSVTGILAPVNSDGSSVFKFGSTVPVKVRVTDCHGTPVSGLSPRIGWSIQSSLTPDDSVNETASTSAADTTGVMRDVGAGQYMYNFATKNLPDQNATYYFYVRDPSFGQVTEKFAVRSK